jgi:hypothetical protein
VRFQSEAFDPARHDTATFDSGAAVLDDRLRDHAAGAQARRVAATFVWCGAGSVAVQAYYSLAAHVLARDRLPRSVGHGSPNEVPAVLLARLALHRSLMVEVSSWSMRCARRRLTSAVATDSAASRIRPGW